MIEFRLWKDEDTYYYYDTEEKILRVCDEALFWELIMSKDFFKGTFVGVDKSWTLEAAFRETAKRLQTKMDCKITAKDILEAQEGLSPITSKGLDNCLREFCFRLIKKKIQSPPYWKFVRKSM